MEPNDAQAANAADETQRAGEESVARAETLDKSAVAALFDEMANLLELDGASTFEVRAYQNASRSIGMIEGDLGALVRSGGLANVPGVGKTIAGRVTELVNTGHLAVFDELVAKIPPGLRQMLRIPGLGPKRVRLLSQELGITTIEDLKAAAEQGRIAKVPGFGAKSQENILKGVEFLSRNLAAHRYDVAEAPALEIAEALRALPGVVRLSVAGSLRRRKDVIKDIDIVASVRSDADRRPIMDALVHMPQVSSVTGSGETKTSVVLHADIALDLRLVSDDEYPYALHHFTGSKEHNVTLRGRAHAAGIKINEYGIFRGDDLIPCKTEEDVYAALGMQYVPPELREDRGEIEAALRHELPELVTDDDLRGILHVHSTWSDGKATIRDMAEATMALGKQYLGICDHSKVAAYANGLNEAAVRRQHEEIAALNAEYAGRFRILKGTECDILRDGALDYDDETLATFDFVVASVHSNFQLPPEEQTARLIRAIENPYCSILGHPTGRILLEREGYNPDLEAVIERAGELGVSIEVNADPHRFDLDWRLLHQARDRGIKIPINPDAHSPAGLRNIRYGVGIARKGWLRPHDVLNTLPVDDLLAFFTEQRRRKGA